MKEQLASQVFSLLSLILIPFIPNSTLQYIALALVFISIAAYLVYQNTLTCQVGRLDAATKEVNTLFEAATAECVADPRFVYETGLKLTEYDPHIGTGTLADYIQAELRTCARMHMPAEVPGGHRSQDSNFGQRFSRRYADHKMHELQNWMIGTYGQDLEQSIGLLYM
ncbi:hypothetical protein DFH08DRAFT_885150 [Mycena albidolilacea]|uniref:Uncharacterized protein n=1 Tax=Mycena albidolilacea TaxID=1033008 RepID=A0AAD6ZK34_9AGAR|nr:hypothetical protein DFH08DRAFT_885150 [Mycena albidolilacea]